MKSVVDDNGGDVQSFLDSSDICIPIYTKDLVVVLLLALLDESLYALHPFMDIFPAPSSLFKRLLQYPRSLMVLLLLYQRALPINPSASLITAPASHATPASSQGAESPGPASCVRAGAGELSLEMYAPAEPLRTAWPSTTGRCHSSSRIARVLRVERMISREI